MDEDMYENNRFKIACLTFYYVYDAIVDRRSV